jgi:ribosomal protein L40E
MCFRPTAVARGKKTCPACQTANPPFAVVCSKCGGALPEKPDEPTAPGARTPKICPACKAQNPPVALKCSQCGVPLPSLGTRPPALKDPEKP